MLPALCFTYSTNLLVKRGNWWLTRYAIQRIVDQLDYHD